MFTNFIQTDECDDLISPDVRSRFSISPEESNSQSDYEEQQDDLEDVIATRHNFAQPVISPHRFGNERPPTARASLLRHPSRRKGLVFPPSIPITCGSATGTPESADEDDLVSETGSDDFDTTLRPEGASLGQELPGTNHATGFLIPESLDTVCPEPSAAPDPNSDIFVSSYELSSSIRFPWPKLGEDITSNEGLHPATRQESLTSPTLSRAYSTPKISASLRANSPAPLHSAGHTTRRKPVPRLEDYDKLFPPRPKPKTVNIAPIYTFPRPVPVETRPIIPKSETERDTVRSKSHRPRFPTSNFRESSPLRKILLPFSRGSRQTVSGPNKIIFGASPVQPAAGRAPSLLGSPIILSPDATFSGRARTSSSPSQPPSTTFKEPSYDSRYLSPASMNSNDTRFNPTWSVPILPTPSTPGHTPDGSTLFEIAHTLRSFDLMTPSSTSSVPSSPSRRRIAEFDSMASPSEIDSRASSRCSTPLHAAISALSLRSIASKVRNLPSTMMRRSSSSQTVTRIAYTVSRTHAVSPGFLRKAEASPYVLGSPWMGNSEPDEVDSLDPPFHGAGLGEPWQSLSVPSSHNPSRTVSPLPYPFLFSQSNDFDNVASPSPSLHCPSSHFSPASSSALFHPFISPQMREQPAGETAVPVPCELDAYARGRPKLKAQPRGIAPETSVDRASRVRSRSEGCSTASSKGLNPKEVVKHKGSFRSFLGFVKRVSAKEGTSPSVCSECGGLDHIGYPNVYLQSVQRGESDAMPGTSENRIWAEIHDASLGKRLTQLNRLTSPSDLCINHKPAEDWYNPNRKAHEEQLEIEIVATSRFVELLDEEHAKDHKRIQAMINDIRADVAHIPIPNKGSSDGEDSIIESYMHAKGPGEFVENEDAYDSDYSLESHCRTLRADDFSTSMLSLDQPYRNKRGRDIGYWYGEPEFTSEP